MRGRGTCWRDVLRILCCVGCQCWLCYHGVGCPVSGVLVGCRLCCAGVLVVLCLGVGCAVSGVLVVLVWPFMGLVCCVGCCMC